MAAAAPLAASARGSGIPAHSEAPEALLARLQTDLGRGLSEITAAERLARDGTNELPKSIGESAVRKLLAQFANPIVLTLLAAAVIATVNGANRHGEGLLRRFGDATAILLIVAVNALLGFMQERRAEAALAALEKMQTPSARVRRDDEVKIIAASQVVVGDVLEVQAGDAVPADARLLHTIDLAAEESALTGESAPVQKDAAAAVAADARLSDCPTMLFVGTTLVRGKGRAVVVATGANTELGRLSALIHRPRDRTTPLEKKLDAFGKRILWGCLALAALLFARGLLKGDRSWHELLLEAVSLAVAAIPEGLPAITTITLALGMQRMANHGAIMRKLAAVETLGAATVICTDKTGTLTQNQMTVRELYVGRARLHATGSGYDPRGAILDEQGGSVESSGHALSALLATAALCNNATLKSEDGTWHVQGDPTEGALLTLAAKGGVSRESVVSSHQVVKELPFDSERRRMTIVALDETGREVAHSKGSVDVLLPLCTAYETEQGRQPLDAESRRTILAEADRMSRAALRVLALARRDLGTPKVAAPANTEIENRLTLLGLVAMMDPPRDGAKEAVRKCAEAHVRAVMITGDHKLTAVAIARELGIWDESAIALTGAELDALSDADLDARIDSVRVFARVTAEQKLRIVEAFKRCGHIVAMTGDGVNDAPALREAHIGVAMGKGGTDVAREAADMVIADDNFATIVEAVREGRAVWRNIQKSIYFLLSSNAGLLVAVFAASFFSDLRPLTPLMILWINLVTNGLPALALGVDPPDPTQMREPPRERSAGLLAARDWLGIAFVGAWMGAAAMVCHLVHWRAQDAFAAERGRAMAFSLLALSPLLHAFNCRSRAASLFVLRPLLSIALVGAVVVSAGIHLLAVLVSGLRPVFRTFVIDGHEWWLLLAMAVSIVPAVEVMKLVQRTLTHGTGALLLLLALSPACGGAGIEGTFAPHTKSTAAAEDSDPGFAEYAATHGITTLDHPEGAPEVTADGLHLEALDKAKPIKLDGVLNEWPAPAAATVAVKGATKASLKISLQYDDAKLYVGGDVSDAAFAPGIDHVSLVLAVPRPGGGGTYASYELGFYAGKPGETEGTVRYGQHGNVPGGKIVEAPAEGGYTFEAIVPFTAIPEMRSTRVGIHGLAAYFDGDAIIATGPGDARHARSMAWVPSEPELSMIEQLLAPKGLTKIAPAAEMVADLTGDGIRERVAVFEHYLTICGTSYLGGTGFFYRDLVGELVNLEVRDVSGRGKGDVVVRRRQSVGDGTREYLEVLSALAANQEPRLTFAHEIEVRQSDRHVDNAVRLSHGQIEVSIEPSTWEAASYQEPISTDVEPILLPWAGVRSQVFRFDGSRFAKVKEIVQEGISPSSDRARGRSVEADSLPASRAALVRPAEPPTPRVTRGGEVSSAQVIDQYRRERGVPAGMAPKVDLAVQVIGDERPERVLLFGRDIVVLGPGVKDGTGYTFTTLQQFADSSDVRDLSARDLTGDGAADLVVRGVRRMTWGKTSAEVEEMFVYEVKDDSIMRVFGIETARAHNGKRMQGLVQFIPGPDGRTFDILAAPGRATGWSARTYPWAQDRPGSGDVEPLLLPWGGVGSVRYTWNGSQFVRNGG